MSSLGDLLQGKVNDQYPSPNDIKVKEERIEHDEDKRNDIDRHHGFDHTKRDDQLSPQSNDDSQQASSQKLFTNRIEKRKIKTEEDCRSNASSTDDYVQELLDPNDRPRNVWHVVEGPEDVKHDGNGNNVTRDEVALPSQQKRLYYGRSPDERSNTSLSQRDDDYDTESAIKKMKVEPTNDNEAFSHNSPKNINDEQQKTDPAPEDKADIDHDMSRHHKDSSRHRRDERADTKISERDDDDRNGRTERRSSSSRRHNRDHHSSSRDDRHHKDRRRESHDRDRSLRSSRRRRDYSDEDDEEDDRGRHSRDGHGSRSRHHRRSHSRSHSRRRDRSDSRSPLTKRNSRTVLVMQLSQRATTRDLEEYFSEIGDVREARLIMDSKTRRHKGIAYIEFEEASSATKALTLDGKKFLGVPMQIQSALLERGRGDWQPSNSSSSHHHHHHHHSSANHSSLSSSGAIRSAHPSSRSNLPPNSYRIYIGGLHVGITDEMLKTIVEPFGQILRIELIKDRNTGASRGYAFILYANTADGQEAVRCLDGFELAGKPMRVSKSTEKGERLNRDRDREREH